LPLLLNMPVMVCENFDVSNGIVNGSDGVVESVCYITDDMGRRSATSCVVTIPDSSDVPFTNLPPHQSVILPKSIPIKIKHHF
ncbi:uncharacterized protein EI90DRAFT_2838501, partial [Cantharellus anzutake]|uniref:uncharacterized protein n=1 Tax=Cantharellus anzutake TaxID=1750568 RepID=UPI001907675A